jgi:hypothetical protein
MYDDYGFIKNTELKYYFNFYQKEDPFLLRLSEESVNH